MSPTIRSARSGDLRAIAALAATQQVDPERHVIYLGTDADSIAVDIAALESWHETTAIAEQDGEVVGTLIAEIDPEMGRVWWIGPFVTVEPWGQIADDLYAHARSLLASTIDEEEACGDVRNDDLNEWCRRNEFVPNEGSALLDLRPHVELSAPHPGVRPLEAGNHAAVTSLHDAAFPGTHTTAARLLTLEDPRAVIVVDDSVVGYVAYEVQSDNSGYIDYLAVAPAHRGAGFGQALVRYASADLIARGVTHVHLSVREGSSAARALYAQVGFTEERIAIPHRKGFTLD